MLIIIANLSGILKSEDVSSLVFLLLLESVLKGITILPSENIIYFVICNRSFGFGNFLLLASNSNEYKVTSMESLLISREHPFLNNNRYSLCLELFDDWGKLIYHVIAADWSDCSPFLPYWYFFIKWLVFHS